MKLSSYTEGAFGVRASHAYEWAPSMRVRIVPPTTGRLQGTGLSAARTIQAAVDFTNPVPASGGSV